MRVLFLARQFPWPPNDGEKVIVYNVIRHLAARHQITLLTFESQAVTAEAMQRVEDLGIDVRLGGAPMSRLSTRDKIANLLSPSPVEILRWRIPSMRQMIREARSQQKFDVAHVDTAMLAVYHVDLAGLPAVLSPHDSWGMLMERIYQAHPTSNPLRRLVRWLELRKIRNFEALVYRRFGKVCVVAGPDALALKKRLPSERVAVIPNGVDTDFFTASDEHGAVEPSVVFSGVMSYFPNEDAVLFFYHQIWPRIVEVIPETMFFIVGRDPRASVRALADRDERIVVTDSVEDIRPYIGRATVYVSPLRVGAGIKNKVLEAMAMGKAIVATPLSCDGIELQSETHVLVREIPDDFASAVIDLIKNKALRSRLGANSRKLVASKYSWGSIATQYEDLYYEVRRL